jgi:hypothetical protein
MFTVRQVIVEILSTLGTLLTAGFFDTSNRSHDIGTVLHGHVHCIFYPYQLDLKVIFPTSRNDDIINLALG